MTSQDREWVKAMIAQAVGELVKEMPKNCPMLRRAKLLGFGFMIGMGAVGVGSPLVGQIITKLFS